MIRVSSKKKIKIQLIQFLFFAIFKVRKLAKLGRICDLYVEKKLSLTQFCVKDLLIHMFNKTKRTSYVRIQLFRKYPSNSFQKGIN